MKKLSKIFVTIFAVSVIAISSVFATPTDMDNAVGVTFLGAVNSSYTAGLQYQRWCTDKIGFQVQGYAFYEADSSDSLNYEMSALNYEMSAQFLLKLYESTLGGANRTCLYAWTLVGHHGYEDSDSYYDDATEKWVNTESVFYPNAQAGIGFGFDATLLNHLSVPIEFGFLGEFPNQAKCGFVFGSGIRYRF